jgi:TPR repeat protein
MAQESHKEKEANRVKQEREERARRERAEKTKQEREARARQERVSSVEKKTYSTEKAFSNALSEKDIARNNYMKSGQGNPYILKLFKDRYSSFYTAGQDLEKVLINAKAGYAEYQYAIGIMYIRGVDLKRNIIEGCSWLVVAVINKKPLAKEALGIAYKTLSKSEKQEVRNRANFILNGDG